MKTRFTENSSGFCGLLSEIPGKKEAAILLMNDDGPDDFLSKIGMKWLNGMGLAAMAVGPEKSRKGLHSWPLENVENAVQYLRSIGYKKTGICGVSAGSNMALSAAARIPDITLTIAMTPMDWVYWGYYHDGADGASERPAEGESAYTWRGKPLPWIPTPWNHPDYWKQIREESKRRGDKAAGLDFHQLAEDKHPLTDEIMIPIEAIRGRLLLAGAEDDVVWDTCRAIRRMQKRLEEKGSSRYEVLTYRHCSHFIFPESMLRLILPGFLIDRILPLVFKETKGFVKECRESRVDLDRHIRETIRAWRAGG